MKQKADARQVSFLCDLVAGMVRGVVEREEEVYVEASLVQGDRIAFRVEVHVGDMGLVLGRRGAVAQAITTVAAVASKKTRFRHVDVDFRTGGSLDVAGTRPADAIARPK